ncbi:MAG: TIGR04282 family arsenosugar biosynthesis glycosyltransferase [Magnetococcales bacterium]|nr:TIGR04282 family arsenosugar biosynthesis glycosyltransferase [Magnetococcales bacterium]
MLLTALHILGREPIPGKTKTRLIPLLGEEGASLAHERLLRHVVRTACIWEKHSQSNLLRLWATGDSLHPLFRDLVPVRSLRRQPMGHLGKRLEYVLLSGLEEADAVILLGGDAASVQASDLNWAVRKLRECPAVMAPAEDGGYVFLGVRRYDPLLFKNIPWGTPRVAERTREALRALGWEWQELGGHWDVDRPEDWKRFLVLAS